MVGLAAIGGILAAKGVGLLADTVMSVADAGIDFVKDKVKESTGIDITSEDEMSNLTPDQVYALKKFEIEHKQFLIEAQLKREQTYSENTKNARSMQKMSISQGDTFDKRFVPIFGAAIVAFCLAYACAITFVEIPPDNIRFADTTLGFMLGTGFATVLNFFFGTSLKESLKLKR